MIEKPAFLVVSCLFLLIIIPSALLAGTLDQPLRDLIEVTGENDLLPVVVLMTDRYDMDELGKTVRSIPRTQRAEIVWTELSLFAVNSQADLMEYLAWESERGRVEGIHSLIACNGIAIEAQSAVIREIAERADVYTILDDSMDNNLLPETFNPNTDELDEIAWGIDRIHAPEVWANGYTGEGVLVAVIDTGVNYNHLDLCDHLWDGGAEFPNHGYDFYNDDNDPMDDNSHGTHCAGIACGDGTAGDQTGVAPDATLMCLKVLSNGGGGAASDVWAGLDFCIEHGVDVISMSLGWMIPMTSPAERGVWRAIFEATDAAGIVSAVCAGNERGAVEIPNDVRCPGNVPSPWRNPHETGVGSQGGVICVGATDDNNDIADFSSTGPSTWQTVPNFEDWIYPPGLICPDITAPGVNINSCWYADNEGYRSDYSGTSMATPHVAGVACLMFSKNPELLPVEIDSIIQVTAWDQGVLGKDNDFGAGIIQADQAVDAVDCVTGFLEGVVTDANTNEPVEGAVVYATRARADTTNANGHYMLTIAAGYNRVWLDMPPYTPFRADSVWIVAEETTILSIVLTVGLFETEPEAFDITMTDTTESHILTVSNPGSAPIDVTMQVMPDSETEPYEYMDQLFAMSVSEATGDNSLNGFVCTGTEFFVAGSNNSSNPNYIYRFSMDGDYLGSFIQPHSDEPDASLVGFRDLACDGTCLYGSSGNTISIMDPANGEELGVLEGVYNPNRALVYDPDRNALWVADSGSDLVALRLATGEEIARIDTDLRTHALAWYADDPDDKPLYILVRDRPPLGTSRELHKADPETGEIEFVMDLPVDEDYLVNGIAIVPGWNTYYTALAAIYDLPDGEDHIVGWELDMNVEWAVLEMENLTLEAGQSQDVRIDFGRLRAGKTGNLRSVYPRPL